MNKHEYRTLVRQAIMKTIPLEVLQLIPDTIKAIESLGQSPEAFFKRIIERAELHRQDRSKPLPTELMTLQQRRDRIAELLQTGKARHDAAQLQTGKTAQERTDDHV